MALSVPAIVGVNGVEEIVPISLDEEEISKLQKSAEMLKEILTEIL